MGKNEDKRFGYSPVVPNKEIDDLIEKATSQIRERELEILDEFSKAFVASEMLTGRDLIGIVKDYELQIENRYENGSFLLTYRYALIEKEGEQKANT